MTAAIIFFGLFFDDLKASPLSVASPAVFERCGAPPTCGEEEARQEAAQVGGDAQGFAADDDEEDVDGDEDEEHGLPFHGEEEEVEGALPILPGEGGDDAHDGAGVAQGGVGGLEDELGE